MVEDFGNHEPRGGVWEFLRSIWQAALDALIKRRDESDDPHEENIIRDEIKDLEKKIKSLPDK